MAPGGTMPQGNSPPAFNMGFLLQGKQAVTRTVAQARPHWGTTEKPDKRQVPTGATPTLNPLYRTTPIDNREAVSSSGSLHVRKMNIKGATGGISIARSDGIALATATSAPVYRSTARITLKLSEQSMPTEPTVQSMPGLNITSLAPAPSGKRASSLSPSRRPPLMDSVNPGPASTASMKVVPTFTPSVKSVPATMGCVTLNPVSKPSAKLTPTSNAGARLLSTATPGLKLAPTSVPGLKPSSTLAPGVKPAPTLAPGLKLAPTSAPGLKPAPISASGVKPAPTSTPGVKPAPTSAPGVKLDPTSAPGAAPGVTPAPTPMPSMNDTTSTATLSPIGNRTSNIPLVSHSTENLDLAPRITLTSPAPYTANTKLPSHPLRSSKLGLTAVPGVRSAAQSLPLTPSVNLAPTSPTVSYKVNWAPISVSPAPSSTQRAAHANLTTSEGETPTRASMPTPPPAPFTLRPVFAGNRPVTDLTATPSPATGTNEGLQNQSSDGESQLHKNKAENLSAQRAIGRQSSSKGDRAFQSESYSGQPGISSPQHRPRSSQQSPVRVPSGGGLVEQTDGETDDETPLEVYGQHKPVLERGADTPLPSRHSSRSIVFKECLQSRQASPNVHITLKSLSNTSPLLMPPVTPNHKASQSTSPPLRMSSQSPTLNMSANVVNLDIEDESKKNEDASHRTVSESTKKLLDRWQLSMSSVPVKPLTTVTLLEQGNTARYMVSPSLPSLNVQPPLSTMKPDYSSRRSHKQDTPLIDSVCLGPDMANSPTPDLLSSVRDMTSSYHMRMDYGKNLERIWYQKMVEEEEKRCAVRKLRKLVNIYKLDGSTDEFYKSFYGSFSGDELDVNDSDDQSIDLNDQTEGKDRAEAESPFLRYASTDVLYSDQDSSSSDIDIVIKEDDLHDQRVRYKMRRKRKQREVRYQTLFGDDKENKFQKHLDENGDEIFLPDTEIRALRLNLKKNYDEDLPYDEDCTIEQLREQVLQALARINGNTKKKSRKKKKKKESDESHGYGEHKHRSLYDRFLHEYGYLLADYQVEQLSESEDSDADPGMGSLPANTNRTLPPISTSQSAGVKNMQYASRMASKHNVHLPKLNHTYQSSPFSHAGMLIGDTYYTGSYTVAPNSKRGSLQNQDNLNTTPRKRKKQRLENFLKGLALDRLELLERSEPDTAKVAPLSSRRMSDPGVYMGQMLVKQKIIHTESELNAANTQSKEKTKPKKKKKGKSKLTATKKEASAEAVSKTPLRPQSGKCGPQYTCEEFVGCKQLRRTGSARTFQIKKDVAITLRELTKDLDFPSKEIKLQVAERRLRRQQQNRGRARRRQEQDSMADDFRRRRRSIIAAAKAEFLLQLEIARAKAKKDQGYHTEDGSEEDDGGDDRPRRSSKRGSSRSRNKVPPFPPPDYRELLNTPVLPSGVSWGKLDVPRPHVSQDEIQEEAEDISDLFLQMKECRWIRWTKTQQRILDHVNQLEMDLL